MPSPITRETLEHLAALARLELDKREEEKLLRDFQSILDYFRELSELKPETVRESAGETSRKNIFRDDDERKDTNRGKGADDFPRKKAGYLEIPAVFE